jgi:peptidoglycan hydrolase-like protein with peptidoglycan-binding domain
VEILDWDTLYREYLGILSTLPDGYFSSTTLPYPGFVLRPGSQGDSVVALQEYLNYISNTYTSIPKITVDGYFGPATSRAVIAYKELFNLGNQGIVSSLAWDSITETYRDLYDGNQAEASQYPGYNLG